MEGNGSAETEMNVNITDHMVSQFLSGLVPIMVLIVVGAVLSILLKVMNKKFAFTRLALILALSPMSLIKFFDQGTSSALYLFAMIVTLLGITIDGINYLLMPKEQSKEELKEVAVEEPTKGQEADVIVWEKAE